jgi:hypothetical protein
LTVGQLRSLRIGELGTYHGASTIMRKNFILESFQNFNVGGGSSAPDLYIIGPDGFEYGFIE